MKYMTSLKTVIVTVFQSELQGIKVSGRTRLSISSALEQRSETDNSSETNQRIQ